MITTLEEFKAAAVKLKATVTENVNETDIRSFRTWESTFRGGCGMENCDCSPGLWVVATEGDKYVKAQFGDKEYWEEKDLHAWSKLVLMTKK